VQISGGNYITDLCREYFIEAVNSISLNTFLLICNWIRIVFWGFAVGY